MPNKSELRSPGADVYRNWIFYHLADGSFMMNVPGRGDEIFQSIESVKEKVDEIIDGKKCKFCLDAEHWHQDGNEVYKTYILITNGMYHRFVINQNGFETFTIVNFCPFCGRKL